MPTEAVAALEKIYISPTNPRKHYDQVKLKELAENVRQVGILQPVLVRKGSREGFEWELIFGTRRFKAAKIAGLTEIPIRIVEMNAQQVAEAQLIENDQREDVHPLEQAEGYELLVHPPKGADYAALTVEEIAARIGRSKAAVYARMKLLELTKENRKRFYEGKLDASRALLLARIPDAGLQDRAGAEITGETNKHQPEPHSYREAQRLIQERYMLRLVDAPFATGDAQLVPKAGSCSTCPKRTGNQKELFADVASADVCTDPICYSAKRSAHFDQALAVAKAKNAPVLEGKAADKVFTRETWGEKRFMLDYRAEYEKADGHTYVGNRDITYRQLLGKSAEITLARTTDGELHELVKKSDVRKAMKEKDPARAASSSSSGIRNGASEKRAREANERAAERVTVERTIAELALLEAADAAAKLPTPGPETTALLRVSLPLLAVNGAGEWYERRAEKKGRGLYGVSGSLLRKAADELCSKAKPAELLAFLVELVADEHLYAKNALEPLFEQLGVDVETIAAGVLESHKQGAIAAAEAKAAKKKKKPAKGKPALAPAAAQ